MCGRFYLDAERDEIARYFDVNLDQLEIQPHYNITPSQAILTITQDHQSRHAQTMRWGLVPAWSKGIDSRYSMINARAESIHQKPAYKRPFLHTRCIIPANGFFEWKRQSAGKQPYCIARQDAGLMAFAGIWDTWQGPEDKIQSCAIVTTQASADVEPIHDRMPVMLDSQSIPAWLDLDNQDTEQLRAILRSADSKNIDAWPISKAVNTASNNSPDLLKAI